MGAENTETIIYRREECGVHGFSASRELGQTPVIDAVASLAAINKRGPLSAGIAVAREGTVVIDKGMGLVKDVFGGRDLSHLRGETIIGQVRYATNGSAVIEKAQPVGEPEDEVHVAHNGNLSDMFPVREELIRRNIDPRNANDSQCIQKLVNDNVKRGMDEIESIRAAEPFFHGSYALVCLFRRTNALVGLRGPLGIRPLSMYEKDGGVGFVSETVAIDAIGGRFLRNVGAGELVKVINGEIKQRDQVENALELMCSLEFAYFAHPDSVLDGQLVKEVRYRMGRRLAQEQPMDVDIVFGLLRSGLEAGLGYADESGIEYDQAVVKEWDGWTFLHHEPDIRSALVDRKQRVIREKVEGKKVGFVDDTIVRAKNTPRVVHMLRKAGAREVHTRIAAPPIRHPEFSGMDFPTREELIAAQVQDVEDIGRAIGADSLGYLSLEGFVDAIGTGRNRLYLPVFNGEYYGLDPAYQRELALAGV